MVPARITFRFDERKAVAAAAYLLKLADGEMPYLRLMKLLYIAERESLRRFNRPICGDRYVAMAHGPVLSKTLDLIRADEPLAGSTWSNHFQKTEHHNLRLIDDPGVGPLSEADLQVLREAHKLCQDVDVWKLRDLTHLLPEWKDPGKSSKPIPVEEILRHLNKTEEEIEEVRQQSAEDVYFDGLFGAPNS
ncbi:MAG: SocA family protein [Planctomycetes bacterium]|nr:SocA family protein [Planctomycetota bacterium]MBI3844696.1 SocA family protein [Planctomycetota bacterium]